MVCRRYAEIIQEHSSATESTFLNFPHGLLYREGAVYEKDDFSNPFITLVERTKGRQVRTVFCCSHLEADQVAPIVQIDGPPSWIQNCHARSLYNRVPLLAKRIPRKEITMNFPIEALRGPENGAAVLFSQFIYFARYFKRRLLRQLPKQQSAG
jgi:hypothetical protein